MTLAEQAKYLFENGEFIGDRDDFGAKKLLYSINGKFFEIAYIPNENVIDFIESRSLEYAIKFYTDGIDLSSID